MTNFRAGLSSENVKCVFNDTGYCKFGQKCRRKHYKILCSRLKCDRKCEGRHPRVCKFGDECDFLRKNICAYKHVTLASEDDECKALKSRLKQVEEENKILKEKIKELNKTADSFDDEKKVNAEEIRKLKFDLIERRELEKSNDKKLNITKLNTEKLKSTIDNLKKNSEEKDEKIKNLESKCKENTQYKRCEFFKHKT